MADLTSMTGTFIAVGAVVFNAGAMWALVRTTRADVTELRKVITEIRDNHLQHIYEILARLDERTKIINA